MTAKHVANYTLQHELGSGAAGTVHLAVDDDSHETVAVKLLNENSVDNPDVQKRFVREVSVLEKLDHPNIVKHHDCGIDEEGRLYFAMEYVDSGTLFHTLRSRRRLPWKEAFGIAIQICDALQHAHERGVIHRDLKPANLFLSSDRQVKVGDFGLARDQNLHRLTADGNTVGTCRYMAPEQIRGKDDLDGAVDIYAVGCILHEMISGRPPFDGHSVIEVFEHHLFTPQPRLDDLVEVCPTQVSDYVALLMAKSASDRPASAGKVAEDLRALAAGETIDMPDPSVFHDGQTLSGETMPIGGASSPIEVREIPASRKYVLPIVLAALAVIVAIAAYLGR